MAVSNRIPRILVVDDSRTIRLVVIHALKGFEVELLQSPNGLEGLGAAARAQPDLILLDVNMPVMGGVEMLTKLKATPSLQHIPVIPLTVQSSRETVLQLAHLGICDYLIIPFTEEFLVERVGRVIELKPKASVAGAARLSDQPVRILLVEDKVAIVERLRTALTEGSWKVKVCKNSNEAVDQCRQNLPDVVLASLSLPNDGGFTLHQLLQSSPTTRTIPIVGLSVKTAMEEQRRAAEAGFSEVITKPINVGELKIKITGMLRLQSSTQYFQQTDGKLLLHSPPDLSLAGLKDASVQLRAQLTEAVDAGLDTLVVDLSKVETLSTNHLKLGARAVRFCKELAVNHSFVGSSALRDASLKDADGKGWKWEGVPDEPEAAAAPATEEAHAHH